MSAGQINEFDDAIGHPQRTDMTLNRDTRVIADALLEAGQPVE